MIVGKFLVPQPDGGGSVVIVMPAGAEPLSVAFQDERLMLWALCDPFVDVVERPLLVVNTGMTMPLVETAFIGTAIHPTVGTVWHVFDAEPRPW